MRRIAEPYFEVAWQAAQKAGRLIRRNFQNIAASDVQVKGWNDFVTRVDREAEKAIKEAILGEFPSHRILAEESGDTAVASDFLWVIDPLDGTTNFIRGIPCIAISLALLERGRTIFALTYDPLRQDLFYAGLGQGAFLNDRPITVSRTEKLAAALGATGFPFKAPDQAAAYARAFKSLLSKCNDMRRCGSAALDLAYTACGRYDFFWEAHLMPWDFMAGKLLIAEAGGQSSDFAGNELAVRTGSVLAANPTLYPLLAQEIGKFFK